MGMDVYGTAPTDKEGEYFRNNVWGWAPLWTYCERTAAPDIIPADNGGHFNDGWGLDAEGATALGERLQALILDGSVAAYERDYREHIAWLPAEPCEICAGTGKRVAAPNVGAGDQPCNGCGATGQREPSQAMYPFSVENVGNFSRFLLRCGGFRIC